ncbi:hypothetical protein DQ400_09440 [Vreelandella sulfidaeris]|uniref:Uncharacterized protein n=1 Tax=Vreelandella sulfidaeris TaxID=115553 RepID=A0A365TN46_9GAMM|nr:hypothetical protein [Halomonas sulfidaeris]RBI67359.1 hypothetical protein DQ400_09440 [Halomonas sulfidaeris]
MIDETKVTTEEYVAIYNATNAIFLGLLKEIRELSKKKPDAIMSAGKVSIINRVLEDLRLFLDKEPEGKFLDVLDDENLPQTSDSVLIMCQYETALKAFKNKYYRSYKIGQYASKQAWVTPEFLSEYQEYEEY